MATIPIEIILQDAESPVTPTPESGGETNITVPDTGAGTINNTSNSEGIGSSASIILPAILLVIALATKENITMALALTIMLATITTGLLRWQAMIRLV